jgi:hypothetical protein
MLAAPTNGTKLIKKEKKPWRPFQGLLSLETKN